MHFPKQIADLSSSHNFTQFQKNIHLNQSSGSEDIVDLKSTILGVFRDDDGTAEFITFHRVLRLLPDQCHWIDNFKIFLLVYYMWNYQWIFDFSWKLDGSLKPLRQVLKIFKPSHLQCKRDTLYRTTWMHIIKKHMLGIILRMLVCWHVYRKSVLVIDGKNNNDDGSIAKAQERQRSQMRR
jgi:hypothetical protein